MTSSFKPLDAEAVRAHLAARAAAEIEIARKEEALEAAEAGLRASLELLAETEAELARLKAAQEDADGAA